MNFGYFRCNRFLQLCEEREDRELVAREVAFLDRHRTACASCAKQEATIGRSLNMLRSVTLEAHTEPGFDSRLIRRIQISRSRVGMGYWYPAILGAGIASFAVFALIQVVSGSPSVRPILRPIGEARNTVDSHSPEPRLLLPHLYR